MTENKDFTLALMVPAIWIGDILFLVLYTIASPVLFFWALFKPESPQEFIVNLFGGSER
ncbi:MAG: hypothetical protein LDL53_03630 [Candidatus Hydrogenedens sp.]|nr:hypothetical protein [Candidatus Hydrogenedens sp.]